MYEMSLKYISIGNLLLDTNYDIGGDVDYNDGDGNGGVGDDTAHDNQNDDLQGAY